MNDLVTRGRGALSASQQEEMDGAMVMLQEAMDTYPCTNLWRLSIVANERRVEV